MCSRLSFLPVGFPQCYMGFVANTELLCVVTDSDFLISAAQPDPALLPSFYIGPNQRQADRAGRDTW